MNPERRAFSLVEVMVTIGVIGVLVSLLLPAVQFARHAAARASCQNNLRQVGLALTNYHAAMGRLPPSPARAPVKHDENVLLGWMALILPHLDQDALYRTSVLACRENDNPTSNPPHVGFATVIPTLVCPADGRLAPMTDRFNFTAAFTTYLGVGGTMEPGVSQTSAGIFGNGPGPRLSDVTDGTSQTIMVGERPGPDSLQAGWWYPSFVGVGDGLGGPNNWMPFGAWILWLQDRECAQARRGFFGPGRLSNPCDRYHFWSLHRGGGNWLFADGSVRFLGYSADPVMPALATLAGGESVTLPD
jgi:prepilin-type N-terminal cleavage/methylation domain-containing protein/prepilin-type processing-associated H-X9-DG protein